jgi:hypothetical protein
MCEGLFTGERVHLTHDCTTTSNGGGICLDRRSQDEAGRSRATQTKDEAGRASMSTRLGVWSIPGR